jgi:hypothetical protein
MKSSPPRVVRFCFWLFVAGSLTAAAGTYLKPSLTNCMVFATNCLLAIYYGHGWLFKKGR